jgi:ribosomal protein S7
MPRKGAVPKRQILPDPRYNSKVLARFINKVMYAGKKSTAERITYDASVVRPIKCRWRSARTAVRPWPCVG